MEAAIRLEGLTKYYGRDRGVVGLDLEVLPGEVFGYLGPNGAGKTTTIRLLLDLIRPSSGRALVLGADPRTGGPELRRQVGYLAGDPALYRKMTGRQLLTYLGHLRGLDGLGPAEMLAERLELDLSRPIGDLSRGNRQKVAVVQAFMHSPQLLVLDEPTSGLDPLMQREFYRLVAEAKEQGRTVFLSSHVLSEVERIADRVGIVREGRLVVVEGLEALKAKALRRLEIHFAGPVPREEFAALPGVQDVVVEDGLLTCTAVGSIDRLVKAAARYEVTNVVSHEADLEELFLRYYEGAGDAA
ncbi:MAG: ABC transporter ATP-binding protein [Acidimicrobiia bacterium]|nr:ABC transporter ATP-binding protein [Acidimicrobiia bacterium]